MLKGPYVVPGTEPDLACTKQAYYDLSLSLPHFIKVYTSVLTIDIQYGDFTVVNTSV